MRQTHVIPLYSCHPERLGSVRQGDRPVFSAVVIHVWETSGNVGELVGKMLHVKDAQSGGRLLT